MDAHFPGVILAQLAGGWQPRWPAGGMGGAPLASGMGGALIGLIFGSYLGTLLVRWPAGRGASWGRSACDQCHRELSWHELLPGAAYVIQRGRCRSCRGTIAWQHPLTEISCAVATAWFVATGQWQFAPFACLLIVLALFDALYLWLPDRLVAALAIFALLAFPWSPDLGPWSGLLGGICGFVPLWALRHIYRHLRARDGLGAGDAKLFGAIGLWLGPLALPEVMLAACIIGLADAFVRLRRRPDWREAPLPMGAYLAIAGIAYAALAPFRTGLPAFGG